MDLFNRVASAKATNNGQYFRDGKYKLEVIKLKAGTKPEFRSGPTFVGEFLVKEAVQTNPNIQPNATGSSVSVAYHIGDENDKDGLGAGNMKAFFNALFNCEGVTVQQMSTCCNEQPFNEQGQPMAVNPMRGSIICTEAFTKPLKNNPNKGFTHHRWEHYFHSDAEKQVIIQKQQTDGQQEAAIQRVQAAQAGTAPAMRPLQPTQVQMTQAQPMPPMSGYSQPMPPSAGVVPQQPTQGYAQPMQGYAQPQPMQQAPGAGCSQQMPGYLQQR